MASLFYFKCSLCSTIASASVFGRYNCSLCARWMRFLFSVAATTPEEQALAARGLVYHQATTNPQPWTCARCGVEFTELRPVFTADGMCCRDCAQAPPKGIATPELITAERARKDALVRDDEDRMEAAYRAAEGDNAP